ncbi:MAG: nucleoside deaminase [Alphaproteobacteria bacterium]|nr:nucleoside deaminase [Alphaproteobacteria bacterium]
MDQDITLMRLALEEAKAAAARDEVPIGALLVHGESGEVVARAGNRTIEMSDPSAHAELLVIREQCARLGVQRLPEYDLYVTLEPCTMCVAAISFARIRRLIIGAPDEKGGGVLHGAKFYEQPTCHHRPEVIGPLLEQECGDILREFFKTKR